MSVPVRRDDIAAQLAGEARRLGLGLTGSGGDFRPVPIALSPWLLGRKQWYEARRAAALLGRLVDRLARRPELLAPLPDSSTSLPAMLAAHRPGNPRARAAPLMRHDLLLDRTGRWRWVETNVTAAGMGPFGERAGWMQQFFHERFGQPGRPVPNPSTASQAQYLVAAARDRARPVREIPRPLIVFAVEEHEDNRSDQDLLQAAIEAAGATVLRRTLRELADTTQTRGDRLCLAGAGCIDLIYFRTGYNAEDFATPELLEWRLSLETHDLALCPTVDLQLAGSKWQQMQLYHADDDFYRRLGFTAAETARLRDLMVPQHALAEFNPRRAERRIERGWLLKSQREGGGSVLTGERALAELSGQPADSILMAPIDVLALPAPTPVLAGDRIITAGPRVAELGLFTAGATARPAGHLVRSKPSDRLEAGIHAGHGML
ncbi:MAG: hypothetical protein ACOCSR_03130, partial [Wenzhouxiangella sp.]